MVTINEKGRKKNSTINIKQLPVDVPQEAAEVPKKLEKMGCDPKEAEITKKNLLEPDEEVRFKELQNISDFAKEVGDKAYLILLRK